MKAKKQEHFSTERVKLYDRVPLDTPFSFIIEPTTFCNLRCNFCFHSLPRKEMEKRGHIYAYMSDETFSMIINQLKQFPDPIKTINFAGYGEPLLHKKLPYMLEEIKKNNLAQHIYIVTNGTLLTNQLSKDLLNAGLTNVRISVNGLSSEDYMKTCGMKIDFDKFLSEIAYLYENKGNTEIYIKILSSALNRKSEEEFYSLFGDYCDRISVEKTLPDSEWVSYEGLIEENYFSRFASVKEMFSVCPLPFYKVGVDFSGRVFLCGLCCAQLPLGSIYEQPLDKIWNGEKHRQIMLNVLRQITSGITEHCKKCIEKNNIGVDERDNLDVHADKIIERVLQLE